MRTKHLYYLNAPESLDFISSLPDNLLHHIVSFLPQKQAVATSLLSWRWRYVWASSPSLDLDVSLLPASRSRRQSFSSFVFNALAFSSSGAPLRRLRLSLDGYGALPEPRLDDWLASFLSRGVEHLDLSFPWGKAKHARIPDCIFTSATLSSLILKSTPLYTHNLPSPAALRQIKTLHLVSLSLHGRFLYEVFGSCQLLEELRVEGCKIGSFDLINSPSLKCLTLSDCKWIHPIQIKISNAPILRRIYYSGVAADDHVFESVVCLQEVILELSAPSALFAKAEECRSCVIKLMRMVGNARDIRLSPWCTEVLCRAADLVDSMRGEGSNLKHLVLMIGRKEESALAIAPFLYSYTNLQYLEVYIKPWNSLKRGAGEYSGISIRGSWRQLKIVKLVSIDESKTGLELVKFLLNNACALEEMIIVPSRDGLEYAKFQRKVSKIKRRSEGCVIKYETIT